MTLPRRRQVEEEEEAVGIILGIQKRDYGYQLVYASQRHFPLLVSLRRYFCVCAMFWQLNLQLWMIRMVIVMVVVAGQSARQ